MESIEQSDIQLAALRLASFLSTKMKSMLPSSTNFVLFDFYHIVPDIPYVNQQDFFKDIELCATKFFMEWFGADNETGIFVRRRIALQGVKDTIDQKFWEKIGSCSDLPRNFSSVLKVLEQYDKKYKKERNSNDMFSIGLSVEFYERHQFLKTAKELGGVVSCDTNTLVQAVQRQFVVDLTERFNQILESVNITTPFLHSAPWLSNKPLEQRLTEKRERDHTTIVRPPVRPPIQTTY